MKLNLDTLKAEIDEHLHSSGFIVFYGFSRGLEGMPEVNWDTVHYPDVGKILYDEAGTWRLHRTDDGSLIREGTSEQLRPLTRWDPNANQAP